MDFVTDKPEIRVLTNLPRSGGTLVGRCIGCMNGINLLSEIHPQGSMVYNPLVQAYEWHNLFAREEMDRLNLRFIDAIQLIHERAQDNTSLLVIRDWAHLDYIGYPFTTDPLFRSSLIRVLSKKFNIREVSLVRHPADIWVSLRKLPSMNGLELETFLKGYRKYAENCNPGSTIKFEAVTSNPHASMQFICSRLNLPFDPEFDKKWYHYQNITGAIYGQARGSHSTTILPLPQNQQAQVLKKDLDQIEDYKIALKLLDYS